MAIFSTVTTTAVTQSAAEVYTPTAGGVQQNPTLVNVGANTCFVGQSGVTATTGITVAVGAQLTLQGTEEAIYAICASGKTTTVESGLGSVVSVV